MRDHLEIWFRVGDDNLAQLLADAAKRGYEVDPQRQPTPVLREGENWLVYDGIKRA